MLEKLKPYSEVIVFFILELCAFLGFSFANSFLLYAIFSFLLLIALILFTYKEIKINKKENFSFLIYLIPFVLFTLLTVLSKFSLSYVDGLTNTFVFIGLLSFISIGHLSTYLKGFNIKLCLYVIYASLALLVLICFIYSMVAYMPFYTFLFDGKYIYYDGDRTTIYNTIKFLMGFRFEDVSIQYFQLFGTMLLSSVIGLRYISFKKEKVMFFSYLFFSLLGFISVLFTIDKVGIITLILSLAAIVFVLFVKKDNKIVKIIIYILLAIFALLLLIFFLNSQSSWEFVRPLQDLIESNSVLNKLFNSNRLSVVYKSALDNLFSIDKLFGYSGSDIYDIVPTGSWFFDTLITSGLFGFISFIVFLVFSVISIHRYNKKSTDSLLVKQLINGFILVFFVYSLIGFDMQPYSHYLNLMPLTQNSLFLIVIFLIGYTYTSKQKVFLPINTSDDNKEIGVDEK